MCFHSIEQGCILRRWDTLWVFFEEKRVCVMSLQHWVAPRGADPVCHCEQLTQICWLICGLPSMHQIGMKIVSINCLPISGQTQRRESDWSLLRARSNFSMPQTRICLRNIGICSSLLWSACLYQWCVIYKILIFIIDLSWTAYGSLVLFKVHTLSMIYIIADTEKVVMEFKLYYWICWT